MIGSADIIVVKIGGSTLGAHDTSLGDVVELQRRGVPVVLVHGGGPAINDWLSRLGTPTRFVRGLRVTDAATLEVVTAVLGGLVNKQLVAELTHAGARVVGLSGADGRLLEAGYEDPELGFVGRLTDVHVEPLLALLAAGFVPLVAPIALLAGASTPQLMNVNADTVAGRIAAALGAARLIFLTDVDGIHSGEGATLRSIDRGETESLVAAGVIAGGMIPKVEAGLLAADGGCQTLIVDGRVPHCLLQALEARRPGTLIERTAARQATS
jgi:acetylglutamate kinase